jgi:hypothetical protein
MLKKRTLTLIFLDSCLLITIFPVVIAAENPDSHSKNNESQIQVPFLHFNRLMEKVIVKNELSLEENIPNIASTSPDNIPIPIGAVNNAVIGLSGTATKDIPR